MIVNVDTSANYHQLRLLWVVRIFLEVRERRFRFQRRLMDDLSRELCVYDRVGICQRGLCLSFDLRMGVAKIWCAFMDLAAPRGHGVLRCMHFRQRLVCHRHRLCARESVLTCVGNHRGYRISHDMHLVVAQDRLIGLQSVGSLDVLGKKHRDHTRNLLGL